jgi:transposase
VVDKTYVFVGIDVSAKELAVAFKVPGKAVEELVVANTAEGHRKLVKLVSRPGLPVRACVEWTGSYSLDLGIALAASPGVEVMMANPRTTKKFVEAARVRAKTDRVDALGLLEFVERMVFVAWTPPSELLFELRTITRRIHQLTNVRTGEKNRLAAAKATRKTPDVVMQDIVETIGALDERIERLSEAAVRLARSDAGIAADIDNLSSIKGIGEATAVVVVAELAGLPVDMTADQVVAYSGLDPRTRESGSSVRSRGAISKRGNARLRGALYMPALAAARFEPAVKEFYARLTARNKPGVAAATAVMRRLLATMWTLLRSKQRFDGDKFRPKVRVTP